MQLPRGRVRHLLAILLIHDGPVSEDVLRHWLSTGARPISGSTLRTHVAALRRALGPGAERVRTEAAGYTVETSQGESDVAEFRELARRGHEALRRQDFLEAEALLERAACLWREPMLADLPDSPRSTPLVMKLAEEHQLLSEALIDAKLGLGLGGQLIPELRVSCEADPPRERAFEQLMIALYRSGRRAEACDVYKNLRMRLVESYGADPGPGAAGVYRQILTDHEDLRASAH
ncbi:AfsR/SARP family transcriptional regulator [Amycolatopsis ultiminotia]|uniref:AfsR/SARP family transcriptional regulator n=1 Tax=Amycolatopsis ultiminotia TaxID=543629 RepID=UPI0031E791D9